MTFRILSIFSVLFFLTQALIAQDPHFTQYYSNPLYLNPATSGTYSGTFRVSMLYRDQYLQPLEESYKTFAASGDVKLDIRNTKKNLNDVVSMGLTFLSDRVRVFDVNTNQLMLTLAYHKALDKRYKQTLGIGFQGGLLQRAVNYENINFQDQFNAINGFTLPTSEFLPPNNITVPDLSTGIYYSVSPTKKLNAHLGVGYQHFTRPNVSYYDDPVILDENIVKTNKYPSRLTIHGGLQFMTSYRLDISPRFIWLQQGEKQTLQLSSVFRIKFAERTDQFFHIGPMFRIVQDVTGVNLETMAAMIGIERKNFILGLSYDWGVSSYIQGGRNFSTLELSMMYIGEHDNDSNFCPQF